MFTSKRYGLTLSMRQTYVYNGKKYYVQVSAYKLVPMYGPNVTPDGLPLGEVRSAVTLAEDPKRFGGPNDIVLGHITISTGTTKEVAEKVKDGLEAIDNGKTLVGCTVTTAFAACLLGVGEIPGGAVICVTEFDGPLQVSAAACFSGIADYAIDKIFGSPASQAVGLYNAVPEGKLLEAASDAFKIGMEISKNLSVQKSQHSAPVAPGSGPNSASNGSPGGNNQAAPL